MVKYDGRYFDIKRTCKICNDLNRVYRTYSKQYKKFCNCVTLCDIQVFPTSKKANNTHSELTGVKDD